VKELQAVSFFPENVIYLENVCSAEHYVTGENEYKPVLENINFSANVGETWALASKNPYEAQLLLYIIGNVKPYYCGRCVLAQKGMMRKKRYSLPHLFFIGNHSALYKKMNVLEYLMLITAKTGTDTVKRQKELLSNLVELGLGYISLTPIRQLTPNEKIMLEILAAALSLSTIIAVDLTHYNFRAAEIKIMQNIFNQLKAANHFAIVFASAQPELIQACCESLLYIVNGNVCFEGTLQQLYDEADKVDYVLTHSNPQGLLEQLQRHLPIYDYEIVNDKILVYNDIHEELNPKVFFRQLALHGMVPDKIEINHGSVQNAIQELNRRHDL